jgi:hypothetical protein
VNIAKFIEIAEIAKQSIVDKACLFAFFYLRTEGVDEFTTSDCARWIEENNFSKPNKTRLTESLKQHPKTIKGSAKSSFKLRHEYLKELDARFPQLMEKSQEVLDDGTILPPVLYERTRGYIESLARQVNSAYENNIFDGCAVLMRRLEEVMLIMAYEHIGISAAIKDPTTGSYLMLERIVSDAAGNATLNLSRNSRKSIEVFRELGNYSAHKITYLCRREYIKEKIDEYRALIDEMLYKSGLRK